MDLSQPTEGVCPLCYPFEEHTVSFELNKNDRPKFYCPNQKTPVNLRGDEASADHTNMELAEAAIEVHADESDESDLEQPAESDADGENDSDADETDKSIKELLGDGDND